MSSVNPFNLKMLQAINDWQISTNSRRGKKLKTLASQLPVEFRECTNECFRKIELDKAGVFSLLEKNKLNEKISSWTTSVNIAKKFKFGVTVNTPVEQSFIVMFKPKVTNVILNLEKVYDSCSFKSAISLYKDGIKDYDKGIGRYGNGQKEIILEIDSICSSDIYMVGGRSSSINVAYAVQIFERLRNTDTVAIYEGNNYFHVLRWLEPTSTTEVLQRTFLKSVGKFPYNVYSKKYGL